LLTKLSSSFNTFALAVVGIFFAELVIPACTPEENEINLETNLIHLLDEVTTFSTDSLVQVIVEIPSGTNDKWEVNKTTGQLEWQKISENSMRVVDYLAYPANYGFVPQTYLPKEAGGDGDPVDIFVLGPSVPRGSVLQVHLIGIIHMVDGGEGDSKLLAIEEAGTVMKVRSLAELEEHYAGVVDILKIWLQNYKGSDRVEVQSLGDQKEAWHYLNEAHKAYNDQKP
jgi:inorganic pyrophosphatase